MSVDKYSNLFHIVALLKGKVPQAEKFNVFTVLRSDSDEVRLHSRFIGSLIDPAYHSLGKAMLDIFLRQMGIHDFPLEGGRVHIEYSGVDILVTNPRHLKAVIVENKIYAGDQPKQLRRYYETIKSQGFSEIYVRYLTLDGHVPSVDSLDKLDNELPPPYYSCVSYSGHISDWLDEAASLAVRNVDVRESVFQYKSVVDNLCGADQGREYMAELRDVLLKGENIKIARDVRQAYIEALVELQTNLWQDMLDIFSRNYPEMYQHLSKDSVSSRETAGKKVSDFYRKRSRYFGVFFYVPGFPEKMTVGVELGERLYVGVRMNKSDGIEERERAKKLLNTANITGNQSEGWPVWHHLDATAAVSFMEPDEEFLDVLLSDDKRRNFLAPYVSEVAKMWAIIKNG